MHTPVYIRLIPLFVLLVWAAAVDLRARRIPNWLTLTVAITGLTQSFFAARTTSPGSAVLGLLVGFTLPFLLFAIGALGGGDVKLLAGVGAWVGPGPALAVFALAAIVGMVVVIAQALYQRRLGTLVSNSALLTVNLIHLNDVGVEHAAATGQSCRSVDRPLPYAVPVLAGTAIVAMLPWLTGG